MFMQVIEVAFKYVTIGPLGMALENYSSRLRLPARKIKRKVGWCSFTWRSAVSPLNPVGGNHK